MPPEGRTGYWRAGEYHVPISPAALGLPPPTGAPPAGGSGRLAGSAPAGAGEVLAPGALGRGVVYAGAGGAGDVRVAHPELRGPGVPGWSHNAFLSVLPDFVTPSDLPILFCPSIAPC